MDGGVEVGMSSLSSKQHLQGLKQTKLLEQGNLNIGSSGAYRCVGWEHTFMFEHEHLGTFACDPFVGSGSIMFSRSCTEQPLPGKL